MLLHNSLGEIKGTAFPLSVTIVHLMVGLLNGVPELVIVRGQLLDSLDESLTEMETMIMKNPPSIIVFTIYLLTQTAQILIFNFTLPVHVHLGPKAWNRNTSIAVCLCIPVKCKHVQQVCVSSGKLGITCYST